MVFNPIQLGALNGAIANLSVFSLGPNVSQNLAGFGYLLSDVYKTEAFRPDLLLGVAKTVTALAHQGETRSVEDIQRGLVADFTESASLGTVRFGETAQILNKARQRIRQKQGTAVSLEISTEQMRSKGVEWEKVAQQMQSVITLAEKGGRKDKVTAFLCDVCEKIDILLGTDQMEAEWTRLIKAGALSLAHQPDFKGRVGGRSRSLLPSQVTKLLERLAICIQVGNVPGRLSISVAQMFGSAAAREAKRTALEILLDEVRLKAEEGTDRNWLEWQELLEMYEGESTIHIAKLVALRNQMEVVGAGTFRSKVKDLISLMRSKGVEWEEVTQQMQSVITLAEKGGRKNEVAAFLCVLYEKIDIPLGTDQIKAEWSRLIGAKVFPWARRSDFEMRLGGRRRGLLPSQVTELLERLTSYIQIGKMLGSLSTITAVMTRSAVISERVVNRTALEMLLDEVRLKAEEGTDKNRLEWQELLEMYEGESTIHIAELVALRNQIGAVEAGTFRSRRVEDLNSIAKIFSKAAGKEISQALIEERLIASLKFATTIWDRSRWDILYVVGMEPKPRYGNISQPVIARLREVEDGRYAGTVKFRDERGQKRQLDFFVTFATVKELGSTRTIPVFHFEIP